MGLEKGPEYVLKLLTNHLGGVVELDNQCDCIYCCPNGHCECNDCQEPCDAKCIEECTGVIEEE